MAWNNLTAGGILCLYPNCNQNTGRVVTAATATKQSRGSQALNHWAEGTVIKMNAEMLPTKFTLTCQITSTSKHGEMGGRGRSDTVGHLFNSTCYQKKLLTHCCTYTLLCMYKYHTNTNTHTHTCASSLCSLAPSLLWAQYFNETVAVSWHNINYLINIEWVINCPSLPALITLAKMGHFRGAKERRGRKMR